MNKITINLNGKELLVDENKSILEVAQNEGILIPTFCHDERLKADASCRVCVVEIEGNKYYEILKVKNGLMTIDDPNKFEFGVFQNVAQFVH